MLGSLIACAVIAGIFLAALRRLRRRYEFRLGQLAERERVATGLHDTLLQSMQGMILRFQGVSHRLPDGSPERATIEAILDQADEVLAEGRHQILALRMPVVYGDNLSQAFAAVGQSLREGFGTPFGMVLTGQATPLGAVGEDVYRIGREALYNAFQHAEARLVELELVYGCDDFVLYVRDNGKGMRPQGGRPAQAGQAGEGGQSGQGGQAAGPHGLGAMRARADAIGATLEVLTLPERGTEVILTVPGKICYPGSHGGWRCRLEAWLGRTETSC